MRIAAARGVFGEKIKVDSIHNCLINELGLKNSNIDGDLKVEHVNKMFKAGILHLCGKYTENNLKRVALTMDIGKSLEDKLYPNYIDIEESAFKQHLGHRKVNWADQVCRGVSDMKVSLPMIHFFHQHFIQDTSLLFRTSFNTNYF